MGREHSPDFSAATKAGLPPVDEQEYYQRVHNQRVSGSLRSVETAGSARCNALIDKRLEYSNLFQGKPVNHEKVAAMKAEIDADYTMLSDEEKICK